MSMGYIASYDDVLQFRKSAAHYVVENSEIVHNLMGVSRQAGLIIFGWFDNLNINVSTPNGHHETHAMAIEFQNHSAGEMGLEQQCIRTLKIPRLSAKQAQQVT